MSQLDVVTGGAGFIGSHLVDALVDAGRDVVVIDNLSVGRLSNLERRKAAANVRFIQGDVADRGLMRQALAGDDRVFHLAALADIVSLVQEPERYSTPTSMAATPSPMPPVIGVTSWNGRKTTLRPQRAVPIEPIRVDEHQRLEILRAFPVPNSLSSNWDNGA